MEIESDFLSLIGLLMYLVTLAYLRGRRRLAWHQHVLLVVGYAAALVMVSALFFPLMIQTADERRRTFFEAHFLFNSPIPFTNWRMWLDEIGVSGKTVLLEGRTLASTSGYYSLSKSFHIALIGLASTTVLTGSRLWMNHNRFPAGRTLRSIGWFVLIMGGLFVAQYYLDYPRHDFDTGILVFLLAGILVGFVLYKAGAWLAHRIKEVKRHGSSGHPDPKPV